MPTAPLYTHTEPTNWNRLTSTKATWFTVAGALSAPGDYLHKQSLWTTDFDPNNETEAGRVVISGVPEGSSIAWKFYSNGSDGTTGEARI